MADRPHRLIDNAIGAILGAACGDALGWPNERVGRSSFRDRQSQASLQEFTRWTRRSGGRYYPHEEVIEAGNYSDDTQLILCLARSLLRGNQWWDYFCRIELPFWSLYERGGGGATKRSVDAWTDGVPPWSRERTTKDVKRYFDAGGNGVAMRVLPHVIFNANVENFACVAKNILLDGIATHGHPRALVGALAYGYALWGAIRRTGSLKFGEVVEDLLDNSIKWASLPEVGGAYYEWLEAANLRDSTYEKLWKATVDEMTSLLETCRKELSKGAMSIDDDALRALHCFDKKISGAGTVATASAVFLASRYAPDPIHGLTKAAYAIGADTDTIASMTGGLLGTFSGSEWLSSLKNTVQDSKYLAEIATALVTKNMAPKSAEIPVNGIRARLSKFMDMLLENKPGDLVEMPDGRQGQILSGNETIGESGKFKVVFRKVACDDGQTLYFSKIKKGAFLTGAGREPRKSRNGSTQLQRSLSFGPKLPVCYLEKAVRFYTEVLGLRIRKRTQEVIVFEQGLVLVPDNYPKTQFDGAQFRALIYIELMDIEKRYSLAKDSGTRIVTPLSAWGNSKRLFFRCCDPDGNVIEVFSYETSQLEGE